MKISSKGLALIKEFEGCYLTAYKCPAGVWTIGWGTTGKVDGKQICAGMKISQAKADALLKQDMVEFEGYVNKLPYKLNQNQFDALVSFTYNCGNGNLRKLTNNGKRSLTEISNALLSYNKAAGKTLAGLTRRRKAEKKLFDTPVASAKKSNTEIAKEVINGKWGNGETRKAKLKAAGYDPAAIQKIVNQLLK